MEETKCEYKDNKTNTSLTAESYKEIDRKYLDEFHEIAFDKSKEWKLHRTLYGIKVESRQGKYGYPISRATTIISNNHLTTPEYFFLFLLKDCKMFYYLTRNVEISLIHTINDVKRIVEAVVTPNSSMAYPRNYLYHEIFALCDDDGNIYKQNNIEDDFISCDNNNNKRKLIVILRSVNKNEKKYYKQAPNTQVRGRFFRTGLALSYISNSESKLVITMEYDVGGSKIIRNFGSSDSKHNEWSFKMCERLMQKLEFIGSYSHPLYQRYNALTIELKKEKEENLKLKRSQLKFKNWKLWDKEDLVLWICDVENNGFQKYKSILLKSLNDQQFNVYDLDKVNEMDLFTFGIANFNERKCLMQHIYALIKGEMVDNSNKTEVILSMQRDVHKNDVEAELMDNVNDEEVDDGIHDNNQIEEEDEEEEEEDEEEEEEEVNADCNDTVRELPENWTVLYTSDGQVYYHNEVTNATQWTVPE